MRIAKIEDGVVVNVEIWPEGVDLPAGYISSETANIGDTYENGEFIPRQIPSPEDVQE